MKIAVDTAAMGREDLDFSPFAELGELKFFENISADRFKELAADCGALIINKQTVDEGLLDACPGLKYVGTFSTGVNTVDLAACSKRGVTVCNVPDYSTHSVSQHVFALLLAYYCKIREYSSAVAAGEWVKSPTFSYIKWRTYELCGKTFGVFGYGNIGKSVAKIASAFGAEVLVCSRTRPQNCPYAVVTFEELLKKSDVLSLHCPLTPETSKIINARTIAMMKDGAVLINTARGGLVDEAALRAALDCGKLACACLDVVDVEPMRPDNPLLGAENCIITPHTAWIPLETRERLLTLAAENLKSFLAGRPINVV